MDHGSSSTPKDDVPMDNTYEYLHGGLDPGRDETVDLLEAVQAGKQAARDELMSDAPNSTHVLPSLSKLFNNTGLNPLAPVFSPSFTSTKRSSFPLLLLPTELITQILGFLHPVDITNLSSTCHRLLSLGREESIWQKFVQENVPGLILQSSYPCNTFCELYAAHDPHWFLSKYKIWFCDFFLTGKLILIRYNPRNGRIEGFRLVCERGPPTFDHWEIDDQVIVHSFDPRCRLHLETDVLRLEALSLEALISRSHNPILTGHRFRAETPMIMNEGDERMKGVFSNFILAKSIPVHPSMELWPPLSIPSRERVRKASQEAFVGSGHKPQNRREVCKSAFRIRRWMEMSPSTIQSGLHLGEEVYTYATLDPKLYTPTEEKPYRGIWVGDYSGHGCEFLLMHQPDDLLPFDPNSVQKLDDETDEHFEERKRQEGMMRGTLEAIKLTGDPNVPRGEHTFVVDDLSSSGLVRIATEERFKGAKIMKSRGHVAGRMFRNSKYIESQLIMVSYDLLAQYWVGFGHISFYQRVDIDMFLDPSNDPQVFDG